MKLPSATPYADHLLVWIDPESCERTESGLYIPDWQPGDKDAVVAVVADAPLRLSPERRLEFPHMDGRAYTFADLTGIPQRGDLVFLRPNTFRPELEVPNFPGVFIVALDRVLASIGPDTDNALTPFQGLLLCEEVWDDDVHLRPDGTRWRTAPSFVKADSGITVQTSIVTEVDPLPVPGCLRVLHTGRPLRGQPDVVRAGDVIAGHPMAFVRHARKQDDIADATEKVAHNVLQPRRVRIGPTEYALVPRQLVMGVRNRNQFTKEGVSHTGGLTAQDVDDYIDQLNNVMKPPSACPLPNPPSTN